MAGRLVSCQRETEAARVKSLTKLIIEFWFNLLDAGSIPRHLHQSYTDLEIRLPS